MPEKEEDGSWEVGFGKPPKRTRFRKGLSGNPKGRPGGSRNLVTVLDEALNERVTISENGRRKSATKLQVMMKQIVNKATQGDYRAIQLLITFLEKQRLTGKDGKPLTIVDLLNAIGPNDENRK
jgi:hypothetical protein